MTPITREQCEAALPHVDAVLAEHTSIIDDLLCVVRDEMERAHKASRTDISTVRSKILRTVAGYYGQSDQDISTVLDTIAENTGAGIALSADDTRSVMEAAALGGGRAGVVDLGPAGVRPVPLPAPLEHPLGGGVAAIGGAAAPVAGLPAPVVPFHPIVPIGPQEPIAPVPPEPPVKPPPAMPGPKPPPVVPPGVVPGIDPATCQWPPRPPQLVGQVMIDPPPPGPAPFWAIITCLPGCKVEYQCFQGDIAPDVPPDSRLYGPLPTCPDPQTFYAACHAGGILPPGQEVPKPLGSPLAGGNPNQLLVPDVPPAQGQSAGIDAGGATCPAPTVRAAGSDGDAGMPADCAPPADQHPDVPQPVPHEPPRPPGEGVSPLPIVGGDICARLDILCRKLVRIGRIILKEYEPGVREAAVDADWMMSLLDEIIPEQAGRTLVLAQLRKWYLNPSGMQIGRSWSAVLAQVYTDRVDDVQALLAVKSVLETWKTLKVDFSVEGSTENHVEVSGHLGIDVDFLPIGMEGAAKGDRTRRYGARMSGEWRPCLAAATELVDYCIRRLVPTELPHISDVIEGYLAGEYSDDAARCLIELQGGIWAEWQAVIRSRRERLTTPEAIELARRRDVPYAELQRYMRSIGWINEPELMARIELYDHLPSISDHLHWLQRNVFDSAYVRDYSLLDGFATDAEIGALPGMAGYQQIYPLAGRNFWQAFGHDLRALGMRQEYAALHYAAHWVNPSPGQLAEMMQRLRPGEVDPSIAFSEADYLRVLAEQDVAPYFRQRFLAISYNTLPLRQLNQATQQGRLTREQLVGRWRDIGYRLEDAQLMADTSLVTAARQSTSLGHGWTPAVVAEMAQARMISREDALDRLTPLGFTPDQVDDLLDVAVAKRRAAIGRKHDEGVVQRYADLAIRGYEHGSVSADATLIALSQAGYSPEAARLEIASADLRHRQQTVDQAVAAIRRSVLTGEVTVDEALHIAVSAGLTPQRADELSVRLRLEMTLPRRARSSAWVLKLARRGVLSVQAARKRLINLGYSEQSVELEMLDLEQTIRQAQLAARERRAKALAKAQRDAAAAVKMVQKGYCRLYSPGKMVRWYARRIIDEATFRDRLSRCGYSDESAESLFREATVAREAADQKAAARGPAGIEYTGPGADAR